MPSLAFRLLFATDGDLAVIKGLAAAEFSVGMMYLRGIGVMKDTAGALTWLHRAACYGSTAAEALSFDVSSSEAPQQPAAVAQQRNEKSVYDSPQHGTSASPSAHIPAIPL